MNTESGRSMVEMLGVLAIIGVLSIGGIAGYTLAMRRYKANEALNGMAMASIYAMSAQGGSGMTGSIAASTVGLSSWPSGITSMSCSDSVNGVIVASAVDSAVGQLIQEIAGSSRASCASDGVCTYYGNIS